MATNVKATCPDCGDISVTNTDVTVRFQEGTDGIEGGEYRFICPRCGRIVLKPTSFNIISLLTASGCRTETWNHPIELLERPNPEDAAPITDDDIIDLGLSLQDEEAWMKMLRGDGDNSGS